MGVCSVLLLLAIIVIWVSEKGSRGAKTFDLILKVMVGLIVVSFFGVVVKMTLTGELNWGEILPGFAPDLSMLFQPAQVYEQFLTQTGEFSSFWENKIVGAQRDVMIAAAASAVGINMTFFMPFVLLRRKWGREHRGLAKFDLWTALLIPYVVATSCVVIAAGSQFNGKPESAYSDFENKILHPNLEKGFHALTTARIITEIGASEYDALAPIQQEQLLTDLPEADKQLAAMLVKRDSFNLAASLEGLLGSRVYSHWIFGIGVVGMALSTIIILMTINGHAVCEVLGKPHQGPPFLMGAFVAGIGVLGPFVWSDAAFWLAVPTSIIGFTLIPLAYLSFFLLINNKRVLGRERPEGKARWLWNAFLLLALGIMGSAAFYVAWNKTWGDIPFGRYALIAFGILLVIGDYSLKNRKLSKKVEGLEMRLKRISQQSESAESKT